MYTNLDQTFVINAVSLEILNAANHVSTTYVKVRLHTTKYGNQVDSAVWSNSRAQLRLGEGLYSLHQLNRLLDFVVKHVFFKVGNALFRQTQGIPMGGNSSPFLANLALLHLERTFVEKYPNTTLQHSIFRYLDDFAVVNHPEFAQKSVYKLVYPDSTGIQLISNTPKHPRPNTLTETQFLDLDIWVTLATNRMPSCTFISLFDKRLAFGFHVIKFPNTYSNTYTPQAQTTFYTEIVRLYRINTHSHLFLQNAMELATFCILHNGFDPLNLFVQFVKFVHQIRHHNHLLPASVLVTSLIPQMLTFLLQHVPQ